MAKINWRCSCRAHGTAVGALWKDMMVFLLGRHKIPMSGRLYNYVALCELNTPSFLALSPSGGLLTYYSSSLKVDGPRH